MLTDTPRPPTRAARYVLRGLAASVGLFGLLRLHWIEGHLVLPLVGWQGSLAARLFGTPPVPVETTLACSGADAMALCLGAVLAYPVPWRRRLAGAAGGLALILGLNIVRIGSLGRAAAAPALFNALHLYIWPAALTLAIAGYVFGWMRVADEWHAHEGPRLAQPSRRFVVLTVAFVIVFAATAPLYLESHAVLALAGVIAHAAAVTIGVFGVSAHAEAHVLWTPRGGFVVTQECISTPLIPVYLAGICAYATSWRRLIPGVLATVPLFTALGVARLLVVALPEAVASPLFFVHAFYQLLLGAVVVVLAALWRHGGRAASGYAVAGLIVGVLFAWLAGPLYTRVVTYPAGIPLDDPQGAIAMLPAFQVGLYLALSVAAFTAVGWGRFLGGLAVLGLMQAAGLLALHALAAHPGLAAPVPHVRGWAVAGPLLIFAAVVNGARTRS